MIIPFLTGNKYTDNFKSKNHIFIKLENKESLKT